MGNRLGGRKTAKVMKIDSQTFKLKTPVRVWETVKDYPGHVLIESEAFKHFGIRAKPLEPQRELKPKKLYFLLEIPKHSGDRTVRRVQSGINMNAVDRLQSLMLSRRSVSDLSTIKQTTSIRPLNCGAIRVQLRLPKSQLMKLIQESKDNEEAAEKIMDLCMEKASNNIHGAASSNNVEGHGLGQQQGNWKPGLGITRESYNLPG
ncbi:hypothetical protein VitviT2T_025790 [Vitis vinifera]|uniref:Uncharacterized protein n=2 Tax=Vitis vinifera TaxID=29760 RepID=A0ABY9DLY0_VITVI|eukprot:XP_002278115.1 PREDICTED: uncharacterized protein At1g66480 [Vitis vinifera]